MNNEKLGGLKTGGLKESPVTKTEILEYLKENLRISAHYTTGWYSEKSIDITLFLDDEEVSQTSVSLPDCKCEKDDRW